MYGGGGRRVGTAGWVALVGWVAWASTGGCTSDTGDEARPASAAGEGGGEPTSAGDGVGATQMPGASGSTSAVNLGGAPAQGGALPAGQSSSWAGASDGGTSAGGAPSAGAAGELGEGGLPSLGAGGRCGFVDDRALWCNSHGRCVGPGDGSSCYDSARARDCQRLSQRVALYCELGHCQSNSLDCEDNNLCSGQYGCCNRNGYSECLSFAGTGAACWWDYNTCGPGLYCDGRVANDLSSPGTCKPWGLPGEGQSCAPWITETCNVADDYPCAAGLRCNSEKICESVHPLCGRGRCAEGEACTMGHVVGACESDGSDAGSAGGEAAGGASACEVDFP